MRSPRLRGFVAKDASQPRCDGERVFWLMKQGRAPARFSTERIERNWLPAAESELLRCPQVEGNARACAVFSSFPQRMRKSWTAWRMTQSDANSSLSTDQPVDAHTAVDKRRLTPWPAVDGAAVDDRPRDEYSNDVLNIRSCPEHSRCEQNGRNLAAPVDRDRRP